MNEDDEIEVRLQRRHLKALAANASDRGMLPSGSVHDPEALAAAYGRIVLALLGKKKGDT